MFELKLTNHSNSDFDGTRTIYKNLVYFGSDYSCDLFTPGKNILPIHGFIEIIGSKLLLHLHDKVESIHLDGKLTTSMRYFRVGQTIKFENYEITVSNFLENHYPTIREKLNELTDELIKAGGKDLEILKSIQEYE